MPLPRQPPVSSDEWERMRDDEGRISVDKEQQLRARIFAGVSSTMCVCMNTIDTHSKTSVEKEVLWHASKKSFMYLAIFLIVVNKHVLFCPVLSLCCLNVQF